MNNNSLYETARREVNIYSNNHKLTDKQRICFQKLIETCKLIDDNNLMPYIEELNKTGLLSPLTLQDDEFIFDPNKNEKINYRCERFIKNKNTNNIIDTKAVNYKIRAIYSHEDKKQINISGDAIVDTNLPLYISKGGVITGEYFSKCVIPKEDINKHEYYINKPIDVPVSIINYKDKNYAVVDHREPTLKQLQHKYTICILLDMKVHDYKFNLRTYKKLK